MWGGDSEQPFYQAEDEGGGALCGVEGIGWGSDTTPASCRQCGSVRK